MTTIWLRIDAAGDKEPNPRLDVGAIDWSFAPNGYIKTSAGTDEFVIPLSSILYVTSE